MRPLFWLPLAGSILLGAAFAQSPDDADVQLPSRDWSDRGLDLVQVDRHTLVAAWVDHSRDTRKRPDLLVVARSNDQGRSWTELFHSDVDEIRIKALSIDVAVGQANTPEPDRWIYVAVQGVHWYRAGNMWWETLSLVSGPLDTRWGVAPHRRAVLDGHGVGSMHIPGDDLHLSCVVAPYRDRSGDRYAVSVAFKRFSSNQISVATSLNGGFQATSVAATGTGTFLPGTDFAHPALAVDRRFGWLFLACEDRADDIVKVGQVQIADFIAGQGFTEVLRTDSKDGLREHAPDITAEDGYAVMVCLEGEANRFGEYRLARYTQTRNWPFQIGPAITSQALGVPDIVMVEQQLSVAVLATQDRSSGRAYPGVFAFEGDFQSPLLPTQINQASVERGVRPRAALRDHAGPGATSYGYTEDNDRQFIVISRPFLDPGN